MTASRQCSVLKCARPEEAQWSTGGQQDAHFEWPVCRPHFQTLRSGAEWATQFDLPNSTRQWIVMGSDLDVRKTESMENSSVSVEFTETGRELRLEFTTGKERFDVLLDDDQALDLGLTVTELSTDEDLGPAPRPDPHPDGAKAGSTEPDGTRTALPA